MKRRYWVGKFESDTQHTDYFTGSITYYGSNKNNNRAFCSTERQISSDRTRDFLHFARETMYHIINTDRDVEFIFYNQTYAYEVIKLDAQMKFYITCLNLHQIIDILNNKAYTRLWFSDIVEAPPFKLLSKENCSFNELIRYFPNFKRFIIQQNNTSGGKGTFLINADNEYVIQKQLHDHELYLASPYFEDSYSVNIHVCVTEKNTIVFPMSLQLIRNANDTLLYSGADFIEAKRIPKEKMQSIVIATQKISRLVSSLGYKGVFGIDFIVTRKAIMFIEINPRFQGSTLPLSKALVDNGFSSIYQLHAESFVQPASDKLINTALHMDVPYSLTQYRYIKNGEYYRYLYERLRNTEYSITYEDGYKPEILPDYLASLYRTLHHTHISHINKDNKLNIAESLFDNAQMTFPIKTKSDLVTLKFSLLTQGARLSEESIAFISQMSPIKDATFNAIDIEIFHCLIVNCPINIPFVELSPYRIEYDKLNGLQLYFDNVFISDVKVDVEENILNKKTAGGISYSAIGFRTNDRVRIKHSSVCHYKLHGNSCAFCQSKHINPIDLPLDDIYEVIESYEQDVKFKHFLIGGASGPENCEAEKIKKIIQFIRQISKKSIYLMSLPPKNVSLIEEFHALGLNEVAFNLEIYDRNIAKKIMPGKGKIPLDHYMKAFSECTKYFGTTGSVRSMFIVGLEPKSSLLNGVRKLCSIGVAPMLSVLRPMPLTKLNAVIPQNVNPLKELYEEAEEICSQHGLRLGPYCLPCQNNTLSMSNSILELLP